ncbi:type I 3-dehydroquinate dehydratase [Coxiella burnetii]|uniref:3-dehydroquinate dehydratase n=4 Tax=Coxiella burnetii TaxID=777 RepID=AROD_COXBU|nr:type I 3-dehydroquinate dehydratase [Coxiella burnetii]NP_821045.1 3-dehydroquinate dehydratase [Coxiella burnetii RSA 493]A9KDC5.1 RecName: Full=3-dehydroquinate dehydratase; Short=3-dehydroquinase; AltName: Full=Type I DHQase; AltName: Full=Type I dehydroquinase; Short=DHQ1 [Coxiella burnetii Dugway 5J108-111]A9N909.1 RecName: Full=3-dehydroquinate dehydratase; Short=3-dehydroquinase; AltName: Full=Type I DHQase; AltName: Full=Type I dehydroquinase; Short=DHQ1 [Coxiella burnetii RSA 331]B6
MLNTPRICVVVIGKTLEEFLSQLEAAQTAVDFVELRIDYLEQINPNWVRIIKNHTHKKAILCCRARADGGKFLGTPEAQQEILQAGNDLGFDYLDIDLPVANKISIHEKKAKIIISYHNFLHTPPITELNFLLENMRLFNPDVFKFATKSEQYEDVKTLFKLLINKKNNENMIVLGMGEQGKIIRLLSPLLGGYLTFSSINGAISAPGQIDFKTMQDFYQRFYKISSPLKGED